MDLPAIFSNWLGLSKEVHQQAAITGLFQMIGVFVTGMVALVSLIATLGASRRQAAKTRKAERDRDERLREIELERDDARRTERVRDVQLALRADIKIVASLLRTIDFDTQRKMGANLILKGAGDDPPYTPFVPRPSAALIWQSISKDIPILPQSVIESVVLFYDQRETLRLFVEDLRSDRFLALDAKRKAAMLGDYVEMQRKLAFHATAAFTALSNSLDDNV